jgi:hypothetical protein
MFLPLRWTSIVLAGCLAFGFSTVLKTAYGEDLRPEAGSHRVDRLASMIQVLDDDSDEEAIPPYIPPCSHEPCPTGFASIFAGQRGILSKYRDDSFVHIVVAGQLHHAWLRQLVSRDPRYWLFEERELTPGKVHRRWAVQKTGSCPDGIHTIWYHQFEKPDDEDAFGDWKLVEYSHRTCMKLNAIPYPADLGPRPKENETGGFESRENESRTAKKPAIPKQIEQAPDAVEEKTPSKPSK